MRRFPFARSVVPILAMAALGVGAAPGSDVRRSRTLSLQREFPDDPPGRPARPVAGAPKAAGVRSGPFTSIQTNVDSTGANIPGDAANEPSLAVDPTHPNHIAIGWRQFDTVASNFRQGGWAFSTDGGRTWESPGVLEPGVFRSDPVLDFDAEGNFYYNSLKVVGNAFTTDVFKSTDGGATWGVPVFAFGGDKQWMAVDRTNGVGHGHVYTTWSIAAACCGLNTFNRSIDGAQSFQTPVPVPSNPVWGTLTVSTSGDVYIAGVDINVRSLFLIAKSSDARDPGAVPSFDFVTAVDMGGSLRAFSGSLSPNPNGLLGQAWIAAGPSFGGPEANLYLVASVDPPGADPLDVHFSRSIDGGLTWSPWLRINDDPANNGAWQWFATMSVAPDGRIDVVWNDTRNTGVHNESELYYTFSTTGGASWSGNQKLSPVWNSHLGFPNQNKIGDYYEMISDRVGAHLAWSATFNGEQDVYYLRIGDYDCNSNGVGDSLDIAVGTSADVNANGIPDECEDIVTGITARTPAGYRLYQNAPNPFNPSTAIRYDVPAGGGIVKLEVFDVQGRRIRTLVDGFRAAGLHVARWDGANGSGQSVASGIYYYRLQGPGFADTRKMVYLK